MMEAEGGWGGVTNGHSWSCCSGNIWRDWEGDHDGWAPFCPFMPKYLASGIYPKCCSSLCVYIQLYIDTNTQGFFVIFVFSFICWLCILLLTSSETLPSIFGNSCANHQDSCEKGFSPCFSISIRLISSLCPVALAGISNMIVGRNGSVGTVDVTEHSTQE